MEDTDLEVLQTPQEIPLPSRRCFATVDFWTFGGNDYNPELQDDGSHTCGSLKTTLTRAFKSSDRGIVNLDHQWVAVLRAGNAYFVFLDRGVARSFRVLTIAAASEVVMRTVRKSMWNGQFGVNGVQVEVADSSGKSKLAKLQSLTSLTRSELINLATLEKTRWPIQNDQCSLRLGR